MTCGIFRSIFWSLRWCDWRASWFLAKMKFQNNRSCNIEVPKSSMLWSTFSYVPSLCYRMKIEPKPLVLPFLCFIFSRWVGAPVEASPCWPRWLVPSQCCWGRDITLHGAAKIGSDMEMIWLTASWFMTKMKFQNNRSCKIEVQNSSIIWSTFFMFPHYVTAWRLSPNP